LRQLPEKPAIGRQPQGQLLGNGCRVGRQLFSLNCTQLARLVFAAFTDKTNAEEIVEHLRVALRPLAEANQLELILFRPLKLAGREANGLLQASSGLFKLALQLPGGAEISGDAEMERILLLGGPQQFDSLRWLPKPHFQRSQVGKLVAGQLAVLASEPQF